MSKYKVLVVVSVIFSFIILGLVSSYRFFAPYGEYNRLEIVYNMFYFRWMEPLGIVLTIIFFICTFNLITYLFKFDKKSALRKYYSFCSILFVIIGVIVYSLFIISFINYRLFNVGDREKSLSDVIIRYLPQMLVFYITTFYLIIVQIYLMKKSSGATPSTKYLLLISYCSSIAFLTLITFYKFNGLIDCILEEFLKLKIDAFGYMMNLGSTHANIKVYLSYLGLLTVIFGILFLLNSRKSKRKIPSVKQ